MGFDNAYPASARAYRYLRVMNQATKTPSQQTLRANGIDIAWDRFGRDTDPAVVLIMGLGGQLIHWPPALCEALADAGLQVIRFDNRDAGLSSWMRDAPVPNLPRAWLRGRLGLPQSSAYGLNDMARDTIGLLDALGLPSAHIVGVSMGGMIAQILAARYPERVASLGLIMTTSGHRRLPGPSLALQARLGRPPRDRSREGRIAHSMQTWQLIGSPAYPPEEAALREQVEVSLARASNPAGMARQLHAIMASGSRTRLVARIRQPTTVIHGTADPLVPVAAADDLARRIAGAQLHRIDGMGHDFPPVLQPRIAQHLLDNIRRGAPIMNAA